MTCWLTLPSTRRAHLASAPAPSVLRAAWPVLVAAVLALVAPRHGWAVDDAVLAAQQERIARIAKAAPAVVAIFAKGGQGGGSGVLISSDGFALTNFHVVTGLGPYMKCGLNDSVLYDAVLVGLDPTGDIALIKLVGRDDFPHATLADSDALAVGDWVYVMGNPFLLATDFQPTVTYGIVSGVHRYQYPAGTILEYTDCIQVDASINPGNSGGPLFNSSAELVGINGRGSFEKRGRVNVGAGYAISLNQVQHFLGALKGGRIVDHAALGATVSTRSDGAVVVADISPTSDAWRRGLRVDDEVLSFAGRPVRTVNQFKNVLGIYPAGWTLPMVFRRGDRKQEIRVRLQGLHHASELSELAEAKPHPSGPKPQPKKGKPGAPAPHPELPQPAAGRPEHPEAPAALRALYEARTGYANYYFNKLEQNRLLGSLKDWGDHASVSGTWKLSGTWAAAPCQLTLAAEGAGMVVGAPEATYFQSLKPGAETLDEPPGTGGLLMALHHLRLLLTRGAPAFSEVSHAGREPLDGGSDLVDVLACELSGTHSNWYFNAQTHELVGFDLRRSDESDACEVRFLQSREFGGRRGPSRLRVRTGEQPARILSIEAWQAAPSAGPAVSPGPES